MIAAKKPRGGMVTERTDEGDIVRKDTTPARSRPCHLTELANRHEGRPLPVVAMGSNDETVVTLFPVSKRDKLGTEIDRESKRALRARLARMPKSYRRALLRAGNDIVANNRKANS